MQKFLVVSLISFLFVACNQNNTVDISLNEVEKAFSEIQPRIVLENQEVNLIQATDFPLFLDTKLSMISDTNTFQFGPNNLELKLENYNLGGGTTDQDKKKTRLYETGQFLYFLKDKKYIGKKKDLNLNFDLKRGINSFFIAPSRSYEMSIKNNQSWLAFELNVTDTKERAKYSSITEPGIFICSPSGIYNEGISDRLLLDFFIINTELSSNGNKVKLTIDNSVNFTLDTWSPFYIEGLKDGKHFLKIELLDKDGKKIEGKYTSFGPSYFSLQSIKY